MFKRNVLVGLLFILFNINGFANEADLAREAKKYKTLEALCLKSKEWSPFGRIGIMIRWESDCIFMPGVTQLQKSKDRYYALSPYVFSNMKHGNAFFKVDGFTDYSYDISNNGSYKITLSGKDIQKSKLKSIYSDFNNKYTKIDYETEHENRNLTAVKKRLKWIHETLKTSKSDYLESLRNAVPTKYTWDTTTYSNNGDKVVLKVTTVESAKEFNISGSIIYSAK